MHTHTLLIFVVLPVVDNVIQLSNEGLKTLLEKLKLQMWEGVVMMVGIDLPGSMVKGSNESRASSAGADKSIL